MNTSYITNGGAKMDPTRTRQASDPVSVLIADTDPRVRSALRLFLKHMPEVSIAGEVQDIAELVTELRRTHPDILLLDWHLAGDHIRAPILQLRALEPRLKKVVVLSLSAEDREDALAAGADAFVRKGYPSEDLRLALRLD
jgi:DNA-binding NarL/FixJ family response regulator